MSSKNELRQAAFKRRLALPPALCADACARITARFLDEVPLPPAGAVISGYVPVNNEVDVFPLMTALIERGYRCAVPHNVERDYVLEFLEWTPKTKLYNGLYNIPQPDPREAESLLPDLLIVPMVAFDAQCNRMGYGSGYFDRTFAHLRVFHKFSAVGIAFEAQKEAEVPTDRHDYRLDGVVTEAAFYAAVAEDKKE